MATLLVQLATTSIQPIIPELKTRMMVFAVTGCWLLNLHLVSGQENYEAHTFLPAQVNIYMLYHVIIVKKKFRELHELLSVALFL